MPWQCLQQELETVCLLSSLSHLISVNENQVTELYVCIIVEAIQNMNLNLFHDYLCQGY